MNVNINIKETAVYNKSSKIIHVSHLTEDTVAKLLSSLYKHTIKIPLCFTSEEVDLLEA